MAERRLSGWQIVTLIMGFAAVIALCGGRADHRARTRVIALAVVFVIGIVLVVCWFLNR